MVDSFKVSPEIICTGSAPSLIQVIKAIKRTKDTKIGKDVSIIKVPVDMLEYCCFRPFVQNTKALITTRYELLCGPKNKHGELEMYHMGETKGEGRKTVVISRRMFVDMLIPKSIQTLFGNRDSPYGNIQVSLPISVRGLPIWKWGAYFRRPPSHALKSIFPQILARKLRFSRGSG